MRKKRILWADDEIEILGAPYRIILDKLGCELTPVTNGDDALTTFNSDNFDLVFLDEQMPGKSGLDVLPILKRIRPEVPVVMITKSEAQDTMMSAIGKQIDDYLVKPVAVPQFAACITKILKSSELVKENARQVFTQSYLNITSEISSCRQFKDWTNLYKTIVDWELKLEGLDDMPSMLLELKKEANSSFWKFIDNNYATWLKNPASAPLLSHRILTERVLPLINDGKKVALFVIDNFRLDQWEKIRPILAEDYDIRTELYFSILPTTTQFARNAIFSGLQPKQIKDIVPEYWLDEADSEESLNQHERELLTNYFERQRKKDVKQAYYKVSSNDSAENFIRKCGGYTSNDLNAFVFSFVDMLSHSVAENRTVRELIPDDAAYRSLTLSWFTHGHLRTIMNLMANKGYTIILTTDHGTIRTSNPVDVKGERELNSNLRFKTGKQMTYREKDVIEATSPDQIGLPAKSSAHRFIFAKNDDFFVYPNNRNEYVEKFTDSFQHGGVSMEEMILPLAVLTKK